MQKPNMPQGGQMEQSIHIRKKECAHPPTGTVTHPIYFEDFNDKIWPARIVGYQLTGISASFGSNSIR